jgi:hypothetical protein
MRYISINAIGSNRLLSLLFSFGAGVLPWNDFIDKLGYDLRYSRGQADEEAMEVVTMEAMEAMELKDTGGYSAIHPKCGG